MYKILCDESIIHDEKDDEKKLYSPKLTLEANTAGTLSFKIYKSNPYYDSIEKLKSIIQVYKKNRIIFKGRVIDDGADFYNCKPIECEGKLAFFNDSVLRPFEFKGSPDELLTMIVENHNAQVKDFQRFKVGRVTVKDNNDYIVRSSERYLKSWLALKEKCFESTIGGYIHIRYEADGDYVDWLADSETKASQSIVFGQNILALSRTTSAAQLYTAMIPVGSKSGEEIVTIASVNEGKDYIVNEELAEEYGLIYAPEEESAWSDVTLPENLLKKAEEKLQSFGNVTETIDITAIDLNLANEEIASFNFFEYADVHSQTHGIHEKYLISKMELDITNPQNTKLTLGKCRKVFTDIQTMGSGVSSEVAERIEKIEKNAVTSEEVKNKVEETITESNLVTEEKAKEIAADAVKENGSGKSAYEIAIENGFAGTEEEWLISLKGEKGDRGGDGLSAFEIAVVNGFTGMEVDWMETLKGEPGNKGEAATIEIGNVVTGTPGTDAKVENVGTANAAVFDFTIPRGAAGSGGGGGIELGEKIFPASTEWYRKLGGDLVEFSLVDKVVGKGSSSVVLLTMPEEYIPEDSIAFTATTYINGTSAGFFPCKCFIEGKKGSSPGKVTLYRGATGGGKICGHCIYSLN